MWPYFKLMFSANYWKLVLRGQTWRETGVALRRLHKDRRAWRQFAKSLFLLLIPLSLPVFVLGVALQMVAVPGVLLIWLYILFMLLLSRLGYGKAKPAKRPDTIAPLTLAPAEPAAPPEYKTPELRRELGELLLLHAVLADRAGSEEFLRTKVVPEGLEIVTRRRHIDLLRERGLYDRLGPVERDLLLLPDGHWPQAVSAAVMFALEPVRLLRWVLQIDSFLPSPGETLVLDFRLAGSLVAEPALALEGEAWVSTQGIETAVQTANVYFYRCWAEGVYRGYYQAEEAETAELRAYALRWSGKESEDFLLGTEIVSAAPEALVRRATLLSLRRVQILNFVLRRLRTAGGGEAELAMFYRPEVGE